MSTAIYSAFMAYLKNEGLARTPQRKAVLEQIIAGPSHFDVEELVVAIRRKKASVSRATVYRTITHLENACLIRKIDFNHPHAHYELITGVCHHEHLICEKCGRIDEFADSQLEQIIGSMARQHGFAITKHTVQIFGICERCREST
ncbi:MAG: Fur family transcriptional regulator [Chitinivibrionales bacterium]